MSRLRARGPLTMEQAVERVVNMTSHLIRASWQPGASGLRALLRDVRRQKYDPIFREVVTAFEQNMLLGAGSQNGVVSPSRSRRASGITRFAMEAAGQREGGSRTSMSAQR